MIELTLISGVVVLVVGGFIVDTYVKAKNHTVLYIGFLLGGLFVDALTALM